MRFANAAFLAAFLAAGGPCLAQPAAGGTQAMPVPASARPVFTLADIRHLVVGTWQSTDDPRFTREFDESGHAVDRYAGDDNALIPGDWNLFAGGDPPAGLPHAGLEPNAVYIVLRQRGDVLLFGLTRADEAALQMVYLGRGNTLNFSRLK